jgi:Niemann-Pick C2 protein
MKVLAVLVAIVAAAAAVDLQYKSCGKDNSAEIVRVFSDDCADKHCKLKKGKTYKIQMTFKPKNDINKLTASLQGVIMGIPVPFPLPEPDGCKGMEAGCPVKAGTESTYQVALEVKKVYPALSLTSRWHLNDGNGDVVCVEIPVTIIS